MNGMPDVTYMWDPFPLLLLGTLALAALAGVVERLRRKK